MAKILAKGALEVDGGCDLNHFLVAALHRTIAFVEVDNIAVLISEDLNLDVFSPFNIAFEKNSRVSEGVLGFFLSFGQAGLKFGRFFNDPHTTTTTAKCGFDDEREADFMGYGKGLIGIGNGVVGARKNRNFGCDCLCASSGFVAHRA